MASEPNLPVPSASTLPVLAQGVLARNAEAEITTLIASRVVARCSPLEMRMVISASGLPAKIS